MLIGLLGTVHKKTRSYGVLLKIWLAQEPVVQTLLMIKFCAREILVIINMKDMLL